jgi:hypothetical protein
MPEPSKEPEEPDAEKPTPQEPDDTEDPVEDFFGL